jgi:hypothetical protein
VGRREQAKALYNRALAALGPTDSLNGESIAEIKQALGALR